MGPDLRCFIISGRTARMQEVRWVIWLWRATECSTERLLTAARTVMARYSGSARTARVSPQGPATGLTEATNGMLYGTSQFGGISGDGTVFALQKDGSNFTMLKNFSVSGEDGRSPYSWPIAVGASELFGTTRLGGSLGVGSVYRLRFDGVAYDIISSLAAAAGPVDVVGSLVESTNGTLFGVSRFGGTSNNGAVFGLNQSGTNLSVVYSPPDS